MVYHGLEKCFVIPAGASKLLNEIMIWKQGVEREGSRKSYHPDLMLWTWDMLGLDRRWWRVRYHQFQLTSRLPYWTFSDLAPAWYMIWRFALHVRKKKKNIVHGVYGLGLRSGCCCLLTLDSADNLWSADEMKKTV